MSDKCKPWHAKKPKKFKQYGDDHYRGRKGKDRSGSDRRDNRSHNYLKEFINN